MDLLKNYLESNKSSLLIYVVVCLFFYIINFAFFRNNIDAPVDLIFTVLYIIIAPGIIVFYIILKNDFLKSNKSILLFINLIVPFLISFVFVMIYWVIEMQESASLLQIIISNGASFPLMIFAVIVTLLFRHSSVTIVRFLLIGIVVFVIYYFALFGFGVIEKQIEASIYTTIGYIVLFFVIPLGYMMYLIRKLDANAVS